MGVLFTLFTMIVTILTVGVMIGITPYIVRRNIHFGVMLPESANQLEITKKWKKQFLTWSILLSALGATIMFIGFFLDLDESAMMHYIAISGIVAIAGMGIIQAVLYVCFHQRVKRFKREQFTSEEVVRDARIMVSTDFHQQKPTVSNGWFILVGGVIILVTAAFPFMVYDQIPDMVPVNWGFDYVRTFREKTPWLFVAIPALQLGMLAIFLFANYSFRKMKQVIRPQDADHSVRQNIRFRQAISRFLLVMGIITLFVTGGVQFMMVLDVHNGLWIGIPGIGLGVVALVGSLYLTLRYGQGGERYKEKRSLEERHDGYQMVDDDEYWILGMIYYNPNDPALFVETRFGMGSTFNMARPAAWLMVLGILAFVIVVTVISFMMVD